MKNKILINIILIIFICLFLYSGYNVFIWVKSDIETKKLEKELYTEIITKEEEPETGEEMISIDFGKLKEINPDIFAWIIINNTYINYPILQGPTNEYYLRKDIYKKYSVAGSIFVYSNVNKSFLDENTVIYGHNMKNDRMFSNLHKIYNGDLGTDIDIQIFTENKYSTYKVFSCYIDEPNLEVIKNKFTENEKKKYIDNAISKSKIKFGQEINYENKIITLITCDSTNKRRVIVHAIEVIVL